MMLLVLCDFVVMLCHMVSGVSLVSWLVVPMSTLVGLCVNVNVLSFVALIVCQLVFSTLSLVANKVHYCWYISGPDDKNELVLFCFFLSMFLLSNYEGNNHSYGWQMILNV